MHYGNRSPVRRGSVASPWARTGRHPLLPVVVALAAILVLAAPVAALASRTGGGDDARRGPISGWLHTSGTQIVDQSGRPVILHSVNVLGMLGGNGNGHDPCGWRWSAPPSRYANDIARFGFNSIRLNISWANVEPDAPTVNRSGGVTHNWNTLYLSALDKVVGDYRAAGVRVILDMHQTQWSPAFTHIRVRRGSGGSACEGIGMPKWLYPDARPGDDPQEAKCEFFRDQARRGVPIKPQEGFTAAWQMLAARYADDPTVAGFDLLNEPGWSSSCSVPHQALADYFTTLGRAIAQVNPHALLVYEDGTFSSYLQSGDFFLSSPPRLQNAVYSIHYYPPNWTRSTIGRNHETGADALRTLTQHAHALGDPFWVGEFDAFHAGKSYTADPSWQTDLAAMMAYARGNGVGWGFWAYSRGAGSSLLGPGGTPKPALLSGLQRGL